MYWVINKGGGNEVPVFFTESIDDAKCRELYPDALERRAVKQADWLAVAARMERANG